MRRPPSGPSIWTRREFVRTELVTAGTTSLGGFAYPGTWPASDLLFSETAQ